MPTKAASGGRTMLHSPAQMLRYRFNTLEDGAPAPVDQARLQQRTAGSGATPMAIDVLPLAPR